jgi:hypothetical protein
MSLVSVSILIAEPKDVSAFINKLAKADFIVPNKI